MKGRTCLIVTGTALLLTFASMAKVVEEVVIKVNDSIVTKSEYEDRLKSTLEGMKREYKGPDLEEQVKAMPQRLLEQMEDELLLVEKAKQLYQVDLIVDNQVEGFMKENHLETKADLAKALEKEGLTMDQFRRQVTLIYVPEFMKSREVRSRIDVSTEEIDAFYKSHQKEMERPAQVRLQEILLPAQDYTADKAKAVTEQIRREYAAGKDFGELATTYSSAFSRANKGEAGWFSKTDLSPEIADAVFPLKAGAVAGPIATAGGWYVFRVEERREAAMPELTEARESVVEAIRREKFNKAYDKYIQQLKAENYIWVNPKYV